MRENMEKRREVVIVITDDDEGHAELIREGLRDSGLAAPILRFADGEELWDFLSGNSVHGETRKKDKGYVILLDINMPRMDGLEVLAKIRSNPEIGTIPVIIFTTTDDPREIDRCYHAGCNIYIVKPVDFSLFTETLHNLGRFLQVIQV